MRHILKRITGAARTHALRLGRLLSGQHIYNVYAAEYLHTSYEDPKCPSYWHGSGCYDIDVYAVCYHLWSVIARSEAEAAALGEQFAREDAENSGEPFELLGTTLSQTGDALARECGAVVGCDSAYDDGEDIVWRDCEPDDATLDDALKAFALKERRRRHTLERRRQWAC